MDGVHRGSGPSSNVSATTLRVASTEKIAEGRLEACASGENRTCATTNVPKDAMSVRNRREPSVGMSTSDGTQSARASAYAADARSNATQRKVNRTLILPVYDSRGCRT